MPQPEFLAWIEFYKLNPFDDYHRFYRPAAHIARSMAGGEIDGHLAWLEKRPPAAPEFAAAHAEGFSAADLNTIKALRKKPPKG